MNLNIFQTTEFLKAAGYAGLTIIIFAETGVLVGLLLPGESLLFTAGFLASTGIFNIDVIIILTFVAAALADNLEYGMGKKYGEKIFTRRHSLLLDQSYIAKAEKFYKKHGGKTIIISRFLPFMRTLAPLLAGVGKMNYPTFFFNNLLGAILWSASISLLGFYAARLLPNAEHYVFWWIGVVVLLTLAPLALAYLRRKGLFPGLRRLTRS